jgi:hypothetical protein
VIPSVNSAAAETEADAMPTITALAPTEGQNTDSSLPDPSRTARLILFGLTVAAFVLAVVMNAAGWTGKSFTPASAASTANFSLFAGFYVAAQVIERLMQLIAPLVPFWNPVPKQHDEAGNPVAADPAVKAAYVKADRGPVVLGIAAVFGVAASCGFGLFFLSKIGIHVSHTIDAFLTGIAIAAGTKPLHDFISLIQNQTTPKTGTGAS